MKHLRRNKTADARLLLSLSLHELLCLRLFGDGCLLHLFCGLLNLSDLIAMMLLLLRQILLHLVDAITADRKKIAAQAKRKQGE